jgi:hypothetical protein
VGILFSYYFSSAHGCLFLNGWFRSLSLPLSLPSSLLFFIMTRSQIVNLWGYTLNYANSASQFFLIEVFVIGVNAIVSAIGLYYLCLFSSLFSPVFSSLLTPPPLLSQLSLEDINNILKLLVLFSFSSLILSLFSPSLSIFLSMVIRSNIKSHKLQHLPLTLLTSPGSFSFFTESIGSCPLVSVAIPSELL